MTPSSNKTKHVAQTCAGDVSLRILFEKQQQQNIKTKSKQNPTNTNTNHPTNHRTTKAQHPISMHLKGFSFRFCPQKSGEKKMAAASHGRHVVLHPVFHWSTKTPFTADGTIEADDAWSSRTTRAGVPVRCPCRRIQWLRGLRPPVHVDHGACL